MEEQILNYAEELDKLTKENKTEAALMLVDIPKKGTRIYVGGIDAALQDAIARAMRSNKDLARIFLGGVYQYELGELNKEKK